MIGLSIGILILSVLAILLLVGIAVMALAFSQLNIF